MVTPVVMVVLPSPTVVPPAGSWCTPELKIPKATTAPEPITAAVAFILFIRPPEVPPEVLPPRLRLPVHDTSG
ncbi:autotransporter-associated beta strand repeat co ntaining protein [Mycolicibacterium thermoresistibile]|uniref:Autotransporter-associated beta strand repeat co ntaining protein n=1 Tax=Mycolicibacterium thermoresistibile TaxID=1797 RepID=A0A100XD36_MYCTH|nr:autotransporter-associated beta strand repeat co ntaining protein [Mycolicibacterium thermoresistibile]